MKIRQLGSEGVLLTELGFAKKTESDMAIVERSGIFTMVYVFSEKGVEAISRLSPAPKRVDSEAHDKVFVLPFKIEEAKEYLHRKFGVDIEFC